MKVIEDNKSMKERQYSAVQQNPAEKGKVIAMPVIIKNQLLFNQIESFQLLFTENKDRLSITGADI